MKKLLLVIISLLLVTSVEAQVSVRRTPKKETKKETKQETKKEAKKTSKTDTKRTTVLTDSDSDKPESKQTSSPVQKTTAENAPTKKTAATKKAAATSASVVEGNSLRRQLFEANQNNSSSEPRWQHIVYRELVMENETNAALSYPLEPVDGLTNCFQVIFEALIKGRLRAYEYLDGREIFSDKYLVKIEDILNTHEIMYNKTTAKDGTVTYEVEQSDIPSNLVMSYYVKEKWEVDRNTSQFGPHVVAICPVLHKLGDFGGATTRYPLFWLDYNDVRPLFNTHHIMLSGMNSTARYTIDDFFSLGLYDGEIYKVQNPRGLTLMQQYPDTAQLRLKREEIETQLQNFQKSVYPKLDQEKEEKTADKSVNNDDVKAPSDSVAVDSERINRRTKKAAKQKSTETKAHSVRRSR